jgi:hypothetical protein
MWAAMVMAIFDGDDDGDGDASDDGGAVPRRRRYIKRRPLNEPLMQQQVIVRYICNSKRTLKTESCDISLSFFFFFAGLCGPGFSRRDAASKWEICATTSQPDSAMSTGKFLKTILLVLRSGAHRDHRSKPEAAWCNLRAVCCLLAFCCSNVVRNIYTLEAKGELQQKGGYLHNALCTVTAQCMCDMRYMCK